MILALNFIFGSNRVVPGFNIPSSTREPKGILGFDLLFCKVSKYSSSITLAFLIRSLAALKYFLSLSIPKYFLPNFLATTAVVPVPKKGSKMASPLFVVAKIILCKRASGFCVE